MGDENHIHTLGDYSKPSPEGYKNTIELPAGNNVDPKQHLKDFLKLVDSIDLDGSISTWEDLTTRFLAQFFPPGRTAKLRNDILIRTIDQLVGGKLRDLNAEESWALLEDLALYDNKSWNDPRDFAKPVKAIALPQDVPSTSDRRLIELENQVQRLMEAHLCSDSTYPKGLVSEFMASQDARLSKFEANFKRQQDYVHHVRQRTVDFGRVEWNLYMQNMRNTEMLLVLVEHVLSSWLQLNENGVIRTNKYAELSAAFEKFKLMERVQYTVAKLNSIIHRSTITFISVSMNHQLKLFTSKFLLVAYQSPQAPTQLMIELPFVDSGFAVPMFSPGDDLIACLNKAMAFLTAVASSRFPITNNQLRASSNLRNQATIQDGRVTVQQVQGRQGQNYSGNTYKSNATSSRGNTTSGQARVVKCYNCQEAQEAGQILDEEQLAFLIDPGIPASQTQTVIPHNAAFQTKDLDTYDSDCDDLSTAQAVLMANISNYGSDVISEVPNSETYLNDMDNQSVHALQDFEQSPVMDFTDNEISSDSNIIPYS
ncbi:hypothetical protein Tco_1533490 [Tanacetum coccineum]